MKAYAIELPDDTVEALKKHWKIETDSELRSLLQELVTLYIVEQEIHPDMTCKEKK